MYLTYSIRFFLLTSFLYLFISCKKGKDFSDRSYYEGFFYCTVEEMSSNQYVKSDKKYDLVIKFYVENDTIKFLNYKIPIHVPEQLSFRLDESNPDFSSVRERSILTYTNEFQNIEFTYDFFVNLYLPQKRTKYVKIVGHKSSLPETTDQSPGLEGNYLLTVTKKDTLYNTVDSHYIAPFFLTKDVRRTPPSLSFLSHLDFHSYYQSDYTGDFISSDLQVETIIDWTVDSFIFFNQRIHISNNQLDTILRKYCGPRI